MTQKEYVVDPNWQLIVKTLSDSELIEIWRLEPSTIFGWYNARTRRFVLLGKDGSEFASKNIPPKVLTTFKLFALNIARRGS